MSSVVPFLKNLPGKSVSPLSNEPLSDNLPPMVALIAETYQPLILFLLAFQYVFVNLAFSTYTQNIVLIKDLSAPLFSMLILIVWIIGDLAKEGRWRLPRHPIVPPMVAALLYWGTTVFFSPVTAASIEEWGMFASYFVQTWALIRFLETDEQLRTQMFWVILCNIAVTGYGLSQMMGQDLLVNLGLIPNWGNDVFVSTHGNTNFLAGYIVTTFPALIGYWFVTNNIAWLLLLPPLILLNLVEVQHSDARGAYIATAVVLFVMVVGMLANLRQLTSLKERWRRITLGTAAALAVVGALLLGVIYPDRVEKMLTDIKVQVDSMKGLQGHWTNRARLIFWQTGIDGGRYNPWFGRGIGGFNYYMPEFRPPWYHRWGVSHNTMHSHDEYFEMFMETGVIGLACLLWIMLHYLIITLSDAFRHRRHLLFPLIFCGSFGPWAVWIQSLFDVETRWTGNAVTIWYTVGLILAAGTLPLREPQTALLATQTAEEEPRARRRNPRARREPLYTPSPYLPYVASLLCLAFAFYCVKAYHYWMADHYLRENMAYTDYNIGNSKMNALKAAEKAREYSYTNVSNYYKLAYTYLQAGNGFKALESYRILQSFAPNYAQIHINLAYLDDRLGYRAASAWERDRAALIEHNGRNHRDAANYWLQLSYPNRALSHLYLASLIERDRTDGSYFFWYMQDEINTDLAQVLQSIGRLNEEVEDALERALNFNPGNVRAAVMLIRLYKRTGRPQKAAQLLDNVIAMTSPRTPEGLILRALKFVEDGDYFEALQALEPAVLALKPVKKPNISPEQGFLTNTILELLQKIFSANIDRVTCMKLAGWVYASQGRLREAEQFLTQAYQASRNPDIAELIGQLKALK